MAAEIMAVHPVLGVRNVEKAIEFYKKLGFKLAFHHKTHPQYAGVRRGGVEIHLQWHAEEEWIEGLDRPVLRFITNDPDELYLEYQSAGIKDNIIPVFDTSWGTREFHMYDIDKNCLMFYKEK